MKNRAKVLIFTGYGLNCQEETKYAFKKAGADIVDKVHINDVIAEKDILNNYNIICFIGGFSFGDHIAAGKVLASKVKFHLKSELKKFIENGNVILGICNGFQTLMKLGLLPAIDGFFNQTATITENQCEHFYDGWVKLKINKKTHSIFINDKSIIKLPVRHGEGRVVFKNDKILKKLKENNQIVFQYVDKNNKPTTKYPDNPNGSVEGIAGITDKTGRILGLMPHPEAFINPYLSPDWYRNKTVKDVGDGYLILENCVNYIKEE